LTKGKGFYRQRLEVREKEKRRILDGLQLRGGFFRSAKRGKLCHAEKGRENGFQGGGKPYLETPLSKKGLRHGGKDYLARIGFAGGGKTSAGNGTTGARRSKSPKRGEKDRVAIARRSKGGKPRYQRKKELRRPPVPGRDRSFFGRGNIIVHRDENCRKDNGWNGRGGK